jgi:hypothetical protein
LRAELDAVFVPELRPSTFMLDRKRPFVATAGHSVELHHVRPAGETEPQRSERHAIGAPHPRARLGAAAIDPLVLDPPFRRPLIFDPDGL